VNHIHITNFSSRTLHGPGRVWTIMAIPKQPWHHGDGAVPVLRPAAPDVRSARAGRLRMDDYRQLYIAGLEAIGPALVPGTLMAYLQRTGPLGGSSVDGELSLSASKLLTSNTAATPAWESANLSAGSFTSGVFSYAGAQYNEVGLIRLHIKDHNYLGEQIPENAINIGRFIPDYFEVSVNSGSLSPFCSPTAAPAFSYIGQPIQYAALPELTIEARNRNNLLTRNYTESGFIKLTPVDVRRFFPSEDESQLGADGLTKMSLSSTQQVPLTFSAASGGVIRYLFDSADTFTFSKNTNARIAPFNSDIRVVITDVEDSDNVGSNAEPYDVLPTPIELRYGRWRMDNAFGPEISSLAIPMQVEYWAGSGFTTNSNDSCTSYAASQLIDSESLTGGSTTPSGSGSFASGKTPLGSEIFLSAPGANNVGTVDLEYLSDAWLRYDWDNNPVTPDTNPTATASFGQYRGHDRIIYWRELNN